MNPAWVSAAIALVLAVGGVALWSIRVMWKTFQKTEAFLDDWNGIEGDRGHKHQPGVMERLVSLERGNADLSMQMVESTRRLDEQDTVLECIKSEVTYNGGHSIKDTVRDIEQIVKSLVPPGHKAVK